ncbi:hypothetical protein ACOSQ4_013361 [Xanthoceras sorbifolium]
MLVHQLGTTSSQPGLSGSEAGITSQSRQTRSTSQLRRTTRVLWFPINTQPQIPSQYQTAVSSQPLTQQAP